MKLKKSFKGFQVASSKYFGPPLIHRRKMMTVMQLLPGAHKFNERRKVDPDQRSVELAEVVLYPDPSNSKHNLRSKQPESDKEEIKVLPLQNQSNQTFAVTRDEEKSVPELVELPNVQDVSTNQNVQQIQNVPRIEDSAEKSDLEGDAEVSDVLFDQKQSWWEENIFGKFCMFFTYSLLGPAEEKDLPA